MIKQTITAVVMTFVLMIAGTVYSQDKVIVTTNWGENIPSNEAIKNLVKETSNISAVKRLESKLSILLDKVEKLEAEKRITNSVPQVDRGVSILVPDARYMGEGKYCYPSNTEVIGVYDFNCE